MWPIIVVVIVLGRGINNLLTLTQRTSHKNVCFIKSLLHDSVILLKASECFQNLRFTLRKIDLMPGTRVYLSKRFGLGPVSWIYRRLGRTCQSSLTLTGQHIEVRGDESCNSNFRVCELLTWFLPSRGLRFLAEKSETQHTSENAQKSLK